MAKKLTSSQTMTRDEETKATLARAFDIAWDRFIECEGKAAATDDNRKRLAAQIVELAKCGESDENVLGEAGLTYLRVRAKSARLGGRARGNAVVALARCPDDRRAQAYSPRTVAAMSAALELCLAALPQRGPPNAMASLSTAVGASRGPRDPERARLHAVEMLMAVCMPELSQRSI
jgi:hypothetical protein